MKETADALGDRIGHVRELSVDTTSLAYHAHELVGNELGRFTGTTALEVNSFTSTIATRVLRQGRLPKLRFLDTTISTSTGALIDALIAAPESVRETLVGWSSYMDPSQFLRCPKSWLGRLELLDLHMDEFESNDIVSLLHMCPSLVTLKLRAPKLWDAFDDEWAKLAFTGSCSRVLEVVKLTGGRSGMSTVSLQTIANHCTKIRDFQAKPLVNAESDQKGMAGVRMTGVMKTWSNSLRDLYFPVLGIRDATADFFGETMDACPLLQLATIVNAVTSIPEELRGVCDLWLKKHPRVPRGTFH